MKFKMDIETYVKLIHADRYEECYAEDGDPLPKGTAYYKVFKSGNVIGVSKNSLRNKDVYRIIKEINSKPLKKMYILK